MDTRVKPAYDELGAYGNLCKTHAGLQRRAAQKVRGLHRCLAGALQLQNPDRAVAAGNGEVIVEHVARRAGPLRRFAAQYLEARLLAVASHLTPGAGKWRQPVSI